MNRYFLQYWKPAQVERELQHPLLDHSGSEQLYRVDVGDVVYIVTIEKPGELFLVGKIQVGECTDLDGAKRHFGTDDIYEATHHVIAEVGTEKKSRKVNITGLASQLRFESKNDRLTLKSGLVDGKQFQSIRELTPASAALLDTKL